MLTKETAHFHSQVSARMLELSAGLPSPSQQVVGGLVPSAGQRLRRTLVEACAGHTPGAPLPPVVTHFAVRAASIVELLHLASLLQQEATTEVELLTRVAVFGLAAKEAAELGQTVNETVAATAADLARGEKTGPLFRLACVLGGQVAGRSVTDLEVLARFGMELGAAVQLLDDALKLKLADTRFQRALAQLDELSDEQARERIVVVARTEWVKLQ
ncbi:polyprenyl synthetase family protein [Kribbella sp. NPDC023855]|uniref:polyprenyl synthetase family protein n=1 Tax=Kribbella sp. NPDC023855 TaxID=3154698 RepID=UPI0033DFDF95